jgi:hypothetical protein
MADTLKLTIQLLDFWHCGTGKGSGEFLDAVADRDSAGLPYVPGKMLKGLLRDAVGLCETWGHVSAGSELALFGARGAPRQLTRATEPGTLRIPSAHLPQDLARWLNDSPGPRQALFRDLFATAVDPRSGAAANRSLRGMEAVVPLALETEIGPMPGRTPPDGWQATLRLALPLVRAVGHQRSRGLGRCLIEIAKEP